MWMDNQTASNSLKKHKHILKQLFYICIKEWLFYLHSCFPTSYFSKQQLLLFILYKYVTTATLGGTSLGTISGSSSTILMEGPHLVGLSPLPARKAVLVGPLRGEDRLRPCSFSFRPRIWDNLLPEEFYPRPPRCFGPIVPTIIGIALGRAKAFEIYRLVVRAPVWRKSSLAILARTTISIIPYLMPINPSHLPIFPPSHLPIAQGTVGIE